MLLKVLDIQLLEMNLYLIVFFFFIFLSYIVLMKYLLYFMFFICIYRMLGIVGLGNIVVIFETDLASVLLFYSFSLDNNLVGFDSFGLNIESVVMFVVDDGSRGVFKNLFLRMQDVLIFNLLFMDVSMDSKNGEQINVCKVNFVFL